MLPRIHERPARFRRALLSVPLLLFVASLASRADANSYAGRLRSINVPRFTGIQATIDHDSTPAVPLDGSSSNFWIGLNASQGGAVTNWVQIGWSRESDGGNPAMLVKRAYVEWWDNTQQAGMQHHLAFFNLPGGLQADYRVELIGANWTWTAGGAQLDTKANGPWAARFCTAQGQAEMIPNDTNVNAVGSAANPSCIRLVETKINNGAYAADNLSSNRTSGLQTNNVNIANGVFPNSFCVWDLRN
jgi:hypothetical protein